MFNLSLARTCFKLHDFKPVSTSTYSAFLNLTRKPEVSFFLEIGRASKDSDRIHSSTIIQDVLTAHQYKPTVAVAYFYFDFNDVDKQRTENLLRSLISQFAAQCLHLPESLQSAHSRSQSQQKHPTIDEMTNILRQMSKRFNNSYILLDALDECIDRDDLLELIEPTMSWNMDNLHLLTTSRKENDISTSLEPLVSRQLCIQSGLVDTDIRVHVPETLSNDSKLKKWPVNVKKEIEDTLMNRAKGMQVVLYLGKLAKGTKTSVKGPGGWFAS